MAVPKIRRSWQPHNTSEAPQTTHQPTSNRQKKKWITKGEKILYSAVSVTLVIAALYIVSFSSSTDTLNRDLQNLEQNVHTQEMKNEELLYEVKELSEPARITKIAKENGLKIQDSRVKQANSFNN
ncbi:MAG TPA: cell division protein FtsL [Bacillota bacterium]